MEHEKKFFQRKLKTDTGELTIEGPLTSEELSQYSFHEKLTAFRPPKKQFEAIKGIADLPEGRIIIARFEGDIVGYVTYLHPDPLERWSEGKMENLIELGAIEVIPGFRGYRVGSHLLEISMLDEYMENYIVISTEYYWHWDLKGTGLSIWQYRKVMEKMMAAGGLKPAPTDDPEIISHPANCLMVRIGKNIGGSDIDQFDRLRFLTKHRNEQRRSSINAD
ncbi:GNAT family N-acetyltransferase [Salimicrobium flavidum]|uniref:Acetoin utilization protein AcuA n=1 Tax=Salimicrobium flavidum TaxID=570947 RepID=A0A1N7JSB6_9BACI|nr:GNAT family N-acetyltransferase [Salimicrobium flavidum]SIS52195.1 acetoin utilization protein AcuA [Salimicrobium flavidum]